MINAGRGNFFVRFCRARASTQTHQMHMHTRSAMQVGAARIRIHEGGRVNRTATEVMPGRRIAMCSTHPAHPSLQQRTLCASDASGRPGHAQGRSQGDSDLPFGVAGKTAAGRTCSISESTALSTAFKHGRGTASTATWMTWLASQWRALRGSETKPRIRSPCTVQASGYLLPPPGCGISAKLTGCNNQHVKRFVFVTKTGKRSA